MMLRAKNCSNRLAFRAVIQKITLAQFLRHGVFIYKLHASYCASSQQTGRLLSGAFRYLLQCYRIKQES